MVVGWNLGKGLQRSHVKDRRCEGYVSHRFFIFFHTSESSGNATFERNLGICQCYKLFIFISYTSIGARLFPEAYGDSLVVPLPAEPRFPGQWQVVGFGVPSDSKQFNESFSSKAAILLVALCFVAGEPPGSTGTSITFIQRIN